MIEVTPFTVALLGTTGFVAGIINTLAGGGSNLTIPALMVMGMPADVANATNRLGVMLHSVSAGVGFSRHGKVATADMVPVLVPTLVGGLLGALLATVLPVILLKPLLLTAMISMSLLILIRPAIIAPELGSIPRRVSETRGAWFALFFAGVYGGFVQAGVGFVLIAALAGTLRYDLVRTNALKVLCVGAMTLISLVVFILSGLVLWLPGLILGLSTMLGAYLAVHMAINISYRTLKWFLFTMTLLASAAAMFS